MPSTGQCLVKRHIKFVKELTHKLHLLYYRKKSEFHLKLLVEYIPASEEVYITGYMCHYCLNVM